MDRSGRVVLLSVVLVVLVALGGLALEVKRSLDAPGPLAAARNVVVPRGSAAAVAAALANEGVIDSPLMFRLNALVTGGDGALRAGEFPFPAEATLREVLAVLRGGRPAQHWLTMVEGATAAQLATLIDGADALTGAAEVPAEGALLPETYAYDRGTPRAALIERARAAMSRALAETWAGRDPRLGLADPGQLLTLASIVERETAKPEERASVAAVYLNRLRLGMKLQADPTVAYAVAGGLGTPDHPLTRAELDRDNPYNTYRNPGLPPGPIGSPGLASLRATAHPARTESLYFVADGKGGHVFARTLDEHQRNVARWRDAEAATRARAVGAAGR